MISYSQDIAQKICEQIIETKSLREISEKKNMPPKGTILRWLSEHDEFRIMYDAAKAMQAEAMADEMIQIADSANDRDSAAAARVQIDTRKWILSKLLPKKYGDKQEIKVTGLAKDLKDDELAAIIARGRQNISSEASGQEEFT